MSWPGRGLCPHTILCLTLVPVAFLSISSLGPTLPPSLQVQYFRYAPRIVSGAEYLAEDLKKVRGLCLRGRGRHGVSFHP
jgi:hypothetical protein